MGESGGDSYWEERPGRAWLQSPLVRFERWQSRVGMKGRLDGVASFDTFLNLVSGAATEAR